MPGKGKGKRKGKAPQRWSLYPKLYGSVSQLLQEENLSFDFRTTDDDENSVKAYDTNVMGRFPCHNPGCTSNGWSSRKIPITIRMYPGDQYNVRVYHQHCFKCDSLSKPVLDSSYAERTAYRLKKWSGVQVEAPPFRIKPEGRPHLRHLCEGCKAGHCIENRTLP